jgi:hypothetical protein
MAVSSTVEDTLSPSGAVRSTRAGDIPDALAKRYYVDRRGGSGLGFYTDARIETASFRDRGRSLVASRTDPKSIRDMAAVARHRGWTTIMVTGAKEFRREAWLAGQASGIEVRGYKPSARDLQDLERRRSRTASRDGRGLENSASPGIAKAGQPQAPLSQSHLKLIEAVINGRVKSPEARERILVNARDRIENWLARGARLAPIELNIASRTERATTPSKSRDR